MKIKTCRICLLMGENMTELGATLRDFIQGIFNNKGYNMNLHTRHYACFECKALLNKSYKFIQKALRAQGAMYKILETQKAMTMPALESINRVELGLGSTLSYCRVDVDFFIEEQGKELKSTMGADFSGDRNLVQIIDTSNIKEECSDTADGGEYYTEDNVVVEENIEIDSKTKAVSTFIRYKIEKNKIENDKMEVKSKKKVKGEYPPDISSDNIVLGCRRRKMKYMDSDDSDMDLSTVKQISKIDEKDVDYAPMEVSDESESPYDSCDDFGRRIRVPKENELEYPRKCDHCSYTIEKSNVHYQHYLFCHTPEEYPYHREKLYVCQFCGVGKSAKQQLRDHEETHGEKNHQCDKCPKKFHNEERLRAHKIRHSDRQLICDFCNKVFKMRADIVLHLRTHTGEKPFKCHICGAGFAHRGNVGIHIKTKHQNNYTQPKKAAKKLRKSSKKERKSTTTVESKPNSQS